MIVKNSYLGMINVRHSAAALGMLCIFAVASLLAWNAIPSRASQPGSVPQPSEVQIDRDIANTANAFDARIDGMANV